MSAKHKSIKSQSQRKQRILKGQSETSISDRYCENFRVSFEYLDKSQGQTFKDWEQEGLLSKMNDTLASYCKEPIHAKHGKKFKEYGEFPSKSGFAHPQHVAQDVNWSALHITGKAVLGGFISGNTFFVVFLDKEHRFWICEKKHT